MHPVIAVFAIAALLSGCGKRRAPEPPSFQRVVNDATVPAGGQISLRTVTRIDANSKVAGEGFPAVLVGDLLDASSEVIATSGSPARLVLLDAGTGAAQLALSALMIRGSWYAVTATHAASSQQPVGGGAPLGTLIRAVSDARAALGPVTRSMRVETSGPQTQVPSGYLLVFRLDQPVRIARVQHSARE